MLIGNSFLILLLLDEKHCNKMRITEDCVSSRKLVAQFAEMCGVNFNEGYVDFLFTGNSKSTFEFSDESGNLLTIYRQPFTTRF